jgi:putative salt-induced outer membrane protein YdiY
MPGVVFLLIAMQLLAPAVAGTITALPLPAAGAVAAVSAQPAPVPEPVAEPAAAEPEPDRWAAAVDLGFAGSTGNSRLTSLTTGFRLKHLQTKRFKLEWSATFRYGESQGEVVARNAQSKLDFDVGPDARIAPFAFASAERDEFRKLDLRARTGSGVKYQMYREKPGEASLRVAALYSRENFTRAAAQEPRTDGAWSVEFKGNRALGESVRVENSTTFAPVFDDFGDHNLDATSKISSRISRRLALTLTHVYSYDSTPAADVGRTDQRFQAGLTIDF